MHLLGAMGRKKKTATPGGKSPELESSSELNPGAIEVNNEGSKAQPNEIVTEAIETEKTNHVEDAQKRWQGFTGQNRMSEKGRDLDDRCSPILQSGANELSVRMVESVGAKRQDIVFDMSCEGIEEV